MFSCKHRKVDFWDHHAFVGIDRNNFTGSRICLIPALLMLRKIGVTPCPIWSCWRQVWYLDIVGGGKLNMEYLKGPFAWFPMSWQTAHSNNFNFRRGIRKEKSYQKSPRLILIRPRKSHMNPINTGGNRESLKSGDGESAISVDETRCFNWKECHDAPFFVCRGEETAAHVQSSFLVLSTIWNYPKMIEEIARPDVYFAGDRGWTSWIKENWHRERTYPLQ